MTTQTFFATHPVFSIDEAVRTLSPQQARRGMVDRLKYHLKQGRLKAVSRGVYAVVPLGSDAQRFRPDPFLVASAVRPDGVFSYHSALELLGAAHSVWTQITLFTSHRRRTILLEGASFRFLETPHAMQTPSRGHLGTRNVERHGKLLEVTGPERTLVEGFRRPALAGGLEELVASAGGFATLDLDLLIEILKRYRTARIWAAVGWFLECFRSDFHVRDELLGRIEQEKPRVPQYIERKSRGGVLMARWNLILPQTLARPGEPDEPRP